MIELEGIELPDDLLWIDETDWTPVEQSEEYSLSGSLVLDASVKQAGRPITLEGYDGDVWIDRPTVLALRTLAAIPGREMTLDMWGQEYTVMFRYADGLPIEVEPVHRMSPPADDDWYAVIALRLMEI